MFDVNGLKHVNDTFGHGEGDELIVSAANSISKAFDDIGKCYRTGGDEFVFISECNEPEKEFLTACNEMDTRLKDMNRNSKYPVSIAIGYAVTGRNGETLKDTLKKADENMYNNKRRMKEKAAL